MGSSKIYPSPSSIRGCLATESNERNSEHANVLAKANEKEISCYEISPSGYGIYWLLIDEDVAIDGLLGITHSFVKWKKTA